MLSMDNFHEVPEFLRGFVFFEDGYCVLRCSACRSLRRTKDMSYVKKKKGSLCRACWEKVPKGITAFRESLSQEWEEKIKFSTLRKKVRYGKSDWCLKVLCDDCGNYHLRWVRDLRTSFRNHKKLNMKCEYKFADITYFCKGEIKTRRCYVVTNDSGYNLVRLPDHPAASKKDKYVPLHRAVMEVELGRHLESYETVHHINGDKLDNKPENLQRRSKQHGAGIVQECGDCGSRNVKAVPISESRSVSVRVPPAQAEFSPEVMAVMVKNMGGDSSALEKMVQEAKSIPRVDMNA